MKNVTDGQLLLYINRDQHHRRRRHHHHDHRNPPLAETMIEFLQPVQQCILQTGSAQLASEQN